MSNPFYKSTGASKLEHPIAILLVILISILMATAMAKKGLTIIGLLLVVPFMAIYLERVLNTPKIALFTIQIAGYFVVGLYRYTGPGIPFGLSADILFVFTFVAVIFKNFYNTVDWKPLIKDISLLGLIWMGWIAMQIINPEAVSFQAWFYTMRGIAFYFFLGIPLVLLLLRKPSDLELFLYIWGCLTILATLKGAIQLNVGLDPWEQRWMDAGAYDTHLLFGKLRVFSFLSDAGQFGASQGQAFVVGGIIAYETKNLKKRIFFAIMAMAGAYGMFISGTRGAIAIPALGFFTYVVLTKNVKLVSLGVIGGIAVYIFFAHTSILQSNYQIARMRTAFKPDEDASFQIRLENQRILKSYLSTRPIGGGIGHAGTRAQKYVPNGFLANVATDSWYVLIWAENGAIGLLLHFFILFYIMGKGGYYIMYRLNDPELTARMMAIHGSIMGILLANYGNAVMGQFPTSINTYYGMAFIFMSPYLDQLVIEGKSKGINLLKVFPPKVKPKALVE